MRPGRRRTTCTVPTLLGPADWLNKPIPWQPASGTRAARARAERGGRPGWLRCSVEHRREAQAEIETALVRIVTKRRSANALSASHERAPSISFPISGVVVAGSRCTGVGRTLLRRRLREVA